MQDNRFYVDAGWVFWGWLGGGQSRFVSVCECAPEVQKLCLRLTLTEYRQHRVGENHDDDARKLRIESKQKTETLHLPYYTSNADASSTSAPSRAASTVVDLLTYANGYFCVRVRVRQDCNSICAKVCSHFSYAARARAVTGAA